MFLAQSQFRPKQKNVSTGVDLINCKDSTIDKIMTNRKYKDQFANRGVPFYWHFRPANISQANMGHGLFEAIWYPFASL